MVTHKPIAVNTNIQLSPLIANLLRSIVFFNALNQSCINCVQTRTNPSHTNTCQIHFTILSF
ncbi:MAG: hypothetical protein LBQ59_04555 [Candidatus Peribacteria bacterium]|nr:hypothetical protein [Candidatus Peribacteria bacterium]